MKPPTPTLGRLYRASVIDPSGCVLFVGYLQNGYGRIFHEGEKRLVHRVAHEFLVGPIPEGMQVDHLCGVRNCINALHLEAVTPLVNTRRAARGQYAKTKCVHGHDFTAENTRIITRADGSTCRACRRCDANRQAMYRERDPERTSRVRRIFYERNRDEINLRRRVRYAQRKVAA